MTSRSAIFQRLADGKRHRFVSLAGDDPVRMIKVKAKVGFMGDVSTADVFSLADSAAPDMLMQQDVLLFHRERNGQYLCIEHTMTVHESMADLMGYARSALASLGQAVLRETVYNGRQSIILTGSTLVGFFDGNYSNDDYWTKYRRSCLMRVFGSEKDVRHLRDYLAGLVAADKNPSLQWHFTVRSQKSVQQIAVEPAKPILPEFYPWIGDAYAYFDRFMASDASILVLLGETGTAKTSFIRSLIWHSGLNTMFTYEESLLKTDQFFVDFITNARMGMMVVEDADLFLTSREHDGNKIMSKFLNVSDGLPSIGKKKMIFTANITDIARIDNALLRTGRCFDCLRFRKLTYAEACAAAKAAGITVPREERDHSLADLFSAAKGERSGEMREPVGFVGSKAA